MIVARVALLTAVAVAVICLAVPSSAQSGGFSLLWIPNIFSCTFALAPTSAEIQQAQDALEKCVASSFTLQVVIQIILEEILGGKRRRRRSIGGSSSSGNSIEDSNNDSNESSNESGNSSIDMSNLPSLQIVYEKMEKGGFEDALLELRNCVAAEFNFLSADGTFDTAALQALILQKVSGLSVLANTQLGIDNCPAVSNFNIGAYMICITTYCITGAGP